MSTLRRLVVSSALLFIAVAEGLHPVSTADDVSGIYLDGVEEGLLISEVYPCAAAGDEYLVLMNRGDEAVNVSGWSLTDGEGSLLIAEGVVGAGESMSLSENASSFASAYGHQPDLCAPQWCSSDGLEASGTFRLADSGDALELRSPDGALVDVVVYGSADAPDGWIGEAVPALREGEVIRRLEGAPDTDTSADWMHFREYRYGYTAHGSPCSRVPEACIEAFVSPDCSLDVIMRLLSGSSVSVRVCSYEFSSVPVCHALIEASSRGVDVRMLVDALPVGGMSELQMECLSAASDGGVDIRVLGGRLDDGVVRHVGALHSKYMVVDGTRLVCSSENFGEDGLPVDELFGNRGWGLSISDVRLASFVASVFDDDSRLERPDVWRWIDDPRYVRTSAPPVVPVDVGHVGVMAPVLTRAPADVLVYLSPDASVEEPFICPMISEGREVVFEQFQAELLWQSRWSETAFTNPLVTALEKVLSSDGLIRGLLDGSWYNLGSNQEVVSALVSAATSYGATASVGVMPEESPITTLHNKGMIIDGASLVSSNNWVYSSFARNRELAVLVRSDEVASYFSRAFELDWIPDTTAPVAEAGEDVIMSWPGECSLDASASWDDRALAAVSWDFDGDGSADAEGMLTTFVAEVPGTYEVRLEVVDAWGNTASDSVTVVVGTSGDAEGTRPLQPVRLPWFIPAAISAAAVVMSIVRKLNLLPPSTRG